MRWESGTDGVSDRAATIFLSAAEASGDDHAARLIESLRRKLPDARLVGVGGHRMAEAGCEIIADPTNRASMAGGPFLQLHYYHKLIKRIQKAIVDLKPDVHVPVDSPAMNWHLARAAKAVNSQVMYYISPQVWAWAPWRVKKMVRLTDQVACILPFEERYLRDRGVRATYVGHPLLDSLPPTPDSMPDLISAWQDGNWRVAMLPGSRPGEIRAHCPAQQAVAKAICRRWPNAKCTFTARDERSAELIRLACKGEELNIAVGRTREVLAESHFSLAVSGTVTLETAYFGVPMVIFYHTGPLVRLLRRLAGKRIVPTPSFALVNILAGRKIVPELMPWSGRIPIVEESVMELMEDLGSMVEMRRELLAMIDTIRHRPNGQSASDNAADLVVQSLLRKSQGR